MLALAYADCAQGMTSDSTGPELGSSAFRNVKSRVFLLLSAVVPDFFGSAPRNSGAMPVCTSTF